MKRLANKIYRSIQLLGLRKAYYRDDRKIRETTRSYRMKDAGVGLDLGSGPVPKNPFEAKDIFGVDIRSNEPNNVFYADIASSTLPFPDGKFDFVTAFDVLEHIPRVAAKEGTTVFPLILLMNEIFRVLKPGGIFFNIQPCYPFNDSFQDPTHVNIMTEDTLHLYFCEPSWARIYGYEGSFSLVDDGWYGSKYFSFLKKSHDKPIRDLEFVQK